MSAHNSTKAGFPLPTIWSKLAGVRSITFDALAAAIIAEKTSVEENNMARMKVTATDVFATYL